MHQLFPFLRFNGFDTEKGNLSEKKMFSHQLKVLHNHHECSIQGRYVTSRKQELKQGLKISKLHKHHIVYRRDQNLKTRAYIRPIIGIMINSNLKGVPPNSTILHLNSFLNSLLSLRKNCACDDLLISRYFCNNFLSKFSPLIEIKFDHLNRDMSH